MSMVAKVFVIINLLMSAVVLAMAFSLYGHHADWQYKYERERLMNIKLKQHNIEKVIRLNAELIRKDAERESLVRDVQNKINRILALNDQLNSIKTEMATREKLVFALTTQIVDASREIERLGMVINQRNQVITKLTEATLVSRANEANMQEIAASTQMENEELFQQTIALETQTVRLQEELATTRNRLATLIAETKVQPPPATPKIPSEVLMVDEANRAVVLNVGSDQQVVQGLYFTVFRENKLVGRIQVVKVNPTRCVAVYDKMQDTPKVGDSAFTRLMGDD